MQESKLCCSLNFAPHYREEIYLRMEREFNCDFCFGDKTYGSIKKLNYSKFENKVKELPFKKLIGGFYFLKGQVGLIFKDYTHYIITAQPYDLSAWLLLVINKLKRRKIFIWNHGWYGDERGLTKGLKRIQASLASGFLLYGHHAKDLMKKEGIPETKLHVVYNSLSYSRQLKVRSTLRITSCYKKRFNNNHPIVLFVGRLTPIKKLDLLIEALGTGFSKGNYFNLVFVGEGEVKESLEQNVKSIGLESRVWFYGACYEEEELGELIYNADLCVSPGNVGLTAIHSLMYGTPVITHNNFSNQMPEFEAIEDGLTGAFFDENSANSLEESIGKWLEKHPTKGDNLIESCFDKIDSKYNPDYQIEILKEILK